MINPAKKMCLFLSIMTTSIFVLASPAAAQTPRLYPCYLMTESPVIDGKPDEAVWKSLPAATGFYLFRNKGFAVKKPTSFRIGWTKDAIYLAARCREPFSVLMTPLPSDCEPLWDDDSIEVFLTPLVGADYFQFIANTVGARWNGKQGQESGQESDKAWNWSAKAQVAGDDWFLEMRIPFKILKKTPAEGDTWRFNVARNMTCGPANERFSSWAQVKQGFGDAANFAALTFRGAPAADDAATAERQMGEEFQKFIAEQSATSVNLVANSSFEDGLNGWGLSSTNGSADPTTATVGNKSIRLDGDAGLHISASQSLKLKPATKYILRCDIKRTKLSTGCVSVDVYEQDNKDVYGTHHRCGDIAGRNDAPNAWGHYELQFQTSTNLLQSSLMLYNINSGAVAWYDGIELVEDDGTDTAGASRASTVIRLELLSRDASAKLVINGENVAPNPGKPFSVRIQEGLNVIGIDAQAHGPNPGVKVRIAGDPLTDTRWRISTQEATAWQARDFDDNHWPLASNAQGWLWASNGVQRAYLRQVVLWNQGHDGPDRCISPLIKEWGISEGAMENLSLMLYSHFPFALDNYEFILDVPKEFRLLDIMHKDGRSMHNVRPAGVATETTEHGGRPYTRYRIAESKTNVGPDRITGQFLPLFLEKWSGAERSTAWYSRFLPKKWSGAERSTAWYYRFLPLFLKKGSGAERSTAWYYRRVAKGNFTELEQKIPVRVLPPINGRFCKKIMISQYCSEPCSGYWPGAQLSPEHYEQHMRQSFQAGFNTWIGPSSNTADKVLKAGGRIIIWSNYPFYGMKNVTSRPGYRWLQEHAEARARYFEDSDTWEKRDQYCPTHVTGEGRADFLAEVKKSYAGMLGNTPGASIIWSDWEETVWVSASGPGSGAREGKGSWCFCDRCKAEFRKWASLPADADLSDAAIFKNYKSQWDTFRAGLDGKVAAIAKQAANELGKPYMLYSWSSHTKLWLALKGSIDLAFPGIPGNEAGDASGQKPMDDLMAMFRDKAGLNRAQVMGQEFAMGHSFAKSINPLAFLNNASAYEDPKLQKREILRIVATLGLGVDLCNSMDRTGGMLYWIGEATRILAAYEDLFHEGERDDSLAACDKLTYPDVLVLKRGDERLVLLFNEGEKPLTVTLRNKDVKSGQTAAVFGTDLKTDKPAEMTVTVPGQDAVMVHIR